MTRIGGNGNWHPFHALQRDGQAQQAEPAQQQSSQLPASTKPGPAYVASKEASYSPHYNKAHSGSDAGSGTQAPSDSGTATTTTVNDESTTEVNAEPTTTAATTAQDVQQAAEDYDAAHTAVEKADEELQAQLAEIGPSLTEAQKQAYIGAYHDAHSDVYEAEAESAADLEKTLSDPAVVEAAASDTAVAEQVRNALAGLAEGNHGQAVIDWLADNMQAAADFGFDDESLSQLVTEAANSASATAATDDDPSGALDDLVQSLAQLKSITDVPNAIIAAADVMQGLQEAIAQGKSAVEAFFSTEGFEPDADPKLMSAAYLMTMAQASNQLIEGVDVSDPNALVDFGSNIATLAQGGAEKVAAAAKNGSEFLDTVSKRINSSLGSLATSAEGVAKIMHAAGGVLSAFAAVVDTADYLNDPNASAWSGMAAIGSLISVVPVPWVAGLGTLLSVIGEVGDAIATRSGRAEEQADLMQEIGLSASVAHAIAHDPSAGAALAEAGLSPEDIQQLAGTHPGLFEPTNRGVEAFAKALISMGLGGADAVALADAMSSGDDAKDYDVFYTLANEESKPGAVIAQIIVNPAPGGLFEAAGEYIHEHHPEIVQAVADRQQATSDYEDGTANNSNTFGNVLLEHDSEAYRAEVITLCKQGGSLELNVAEVAASGSTAEKKAVAEALADAYDAGYIDYATANEYRETLGQPPLPAPAD